MSNNKSYQQLHKISKEIAILDSINRLLEWDQETYMPKGGTSFRSQQRESLASHVHKQKTGPKFTKALQKLIDLETAEIVDTTLSPSQTSALREWHRDYLRDSKLPNAFVKTFTKTVSSSIPLWIQAKKEEKFKLFAPALEKLVQLCRKKADLLGYKEHPYDALLDLYEPNMTVKTLDKLFERLKISLTELVKKIGACEKINSNFLRGEFPEEKQIHFGRLLLKTMRFNEEHARLDLSSHPFCSAITPTDLRMTTRIHPEFLMYNIFAVIHEGGHGLYHLGFPEAEFGSPLADAVSLGIDESQSLFWEKRIGRSYPFWQYCYPLLQKEFPEQLQGIYLDDFFRAINIVEPTFIRVEADEVTYCLHVILRYEVEKGLIEGSIKVKDLPEIWNEKMRLYLGIQPHSDSQGCLQDIHWAFGGIGYFPTYALGNLYSVQFFAAFEKAHPEWKNAAARGDLSIILKWLQTNIHQYGRQFSADELAVRITGEPLSVVPFVTYLENKYKAIYHF